MRRGGSRIFVRGWGATIYYKGREPKKKIFHTSSHILAYFKHII